jgi:hypothetical protein
MKRIYLHELWKVAEDSIQIESLYLIIHICIIIPKICGAECCVDVRQESDREWILLGQATLSSGMESPINLSLVTLINYIKTLEFCPNITLNVLVYPLWRSAACFALSRITRLRISDTDSIPSERGQVYTGQTGWLLKLGWKNIMGTFSLDNQKG